MIFMFLKLPNPNMKFFTNAFTTSFNIYSQVGLVTLVGLIAKNAILIVEFANKLQQEGRDKVQAVARRRGSDCVRSDDHIRYRSRSHAARFRYWRRREARNSIVLGVLVGGMTIGTLFTLFIVPSLYVLIARRHNEGSMERRSRGEARSAP
jgi:multidrug efflux pump